MRIRSAAPEDFAALQDIERAAGGMFRAVDMPEIADDDPFSVEELTHFQSAGRAWVAEEAGRPIGYLVAELVDGNVHVEQVSVHPDAAGRGVGRSLLDHVASWAAEEGAPALTLTTFSEVPWNAPYYERYGFRRLDEPELTPGLWEIRARESADGLDRWSRVCMRLDLLDHGSASSSPQET